MDISRIQPIPNDGVLFIEKKKILVVADLHIGIETELQEKGLNTSSQIKKMIKHFIEISHFHSFHSFKRLYVYFCHFRFDK